LEAELLAESEKLHDAVANGTVKPYRNVAEMFEEWDKEDAENDDE
jgi:hypothetical protein